MSSAWTTPVVMPPSSPELSRKVAIVGVGETDYHKDYQAARAKPEGYELPTPEKLAVTAFERALADSGLKREDIDGLQVSFLHGGPSSQETCGLLGIKPKYVSDSLGIMAGPLPQACAAVAAGECDTMAMVYAVASRAAGRQYGGYTHSGENEKTPKSYYYFHPWGFSSQAAHWALIWQHYQWRYGAREEDLGYVGMQLRENASKQPNAVMQTPFTIEDYMASRYVVRPLHLLDMCLSNDGGVCLIIRRSDIAKDLAHKPVHVAGWSEAKIHGEKFDALVRKRLRPELQASGAEALKMAGLGLSDIQHLECYDAASIHIANQIEGFGFVEEGSALDGFKRGDMAPGGKLPVNTGGGMMSGSYMHGWSHLAEITRQLRGEAGPTQIPGVKVSMFSLAQTDQVHPIIFTAGN